jgi:hypothetical protein
MSEHNPVLHVPVMQVQENHRSGKRGDTWSVTIDGASIDSAGEGAGDGADDGTAGPVDSWNHAKELAASKNCRLEPPTPGLRREMVEAGVAREEFGESSSAALFSHPHGSPDI